MDLSPDRPHARDLTRGPRNIILFSDGTGNSSGKLQKTNVWRLYEALDLGYPVANGLPVQIAYYDNGVGTSAFQLFAALGGVFGFGLARNIRTIYKFLCRNYQPGDRIYLFGFSRGAFTVRLLGALITALGVVTDLGEESLDMAAHDTWREFRRGFHTNNELTDLGVRLGMATTFAILRLVRSDLDDNADLGEKPDHGAAGKAWWYARRAGRWVARRLTGAHGTFVRRADGGWSALHDWYEHWNRPLDQRRMPEFVAARGIHHTPDIEFVGVWDTVAAYGGPLVEITRGIDEWIWPLTMPTYDLSHKVKRARHALSIDDKRDSFQPLLWDEVNEQALAAKYRHAANGAGKPVDDEHRALALRFCHEERPRLQQVWFAGMHADVGGGYADESLSFVSLWWMIEHAKEMAPEDDLSIAAYDALPDAGKALTSDPRRRGLRLIPEFEHRIETFRNVYGPLHDSRGGAGMFYRYQPRYIGAWVNRAADDTGSHVKPATQQFRDPTIAQGRYRRHGLLQAPIRLHLSVEERLRMATDGYAPINIPRDYHIDNGVHEAPEPEGASIDATLDQTYLDALTVRIKLRRFWYFLQMFLVFLLLIKPLWPHIKGLAMFAGQVDARTNSQVLETAINAFVPSFLATWTHAIAADPFNSLLFFAVMGVVAMVGATHEQGLADISRRMWAARFGQSLPPLPTLNWFNRFFYRRTDELAKSEAAQSVLARLKWRIVPFFVGGIMWLGIAYAVVAGVTQGWLAWAESDPRICVAKGGANPIGPMTWTDPVFAAEACHDLNIEVKPNTSYRIVLKVRSSGYIVTRDRTVPGGKTLSGPTPLFFDGALPATPQGWAVDGLKFRAVHGVSRYFRRVARAPVMAPVFEIRHRGADVPETFHVLSLHSWANLLLGLRGEPNYMVVPPLVHSLLPGHEDEWTGTLRTPDAGARVFRSLEYAATGSGDEAVPGRLFVFLNDAVLPIDHAQLQPDDATLPSGPLWLPPTQQLATLNHDCPTLPGRWLTSWIPLLHRARVLDLCSRYANNRGSYTLSLSPLNDTVEGAAPLPAAPRN
ncbi:DUF2235 domain-containing protein [Novosphingobium lentum]|uniref:DUF2235 domain-containing protein n=1 Tax=Novosphingobium lentum TaxID=145287 RepID=UPI0008321F3C|nr:DUF2235 domain-containing protein [Novosphingobium lentum]